MLIWVQSYNFFLTYARAMTIFYDKIRDSYVTSGRFVCFLSRICDSSNQKVSKLTSVFWGGYLWCVGCDNFHCKQPDELDTYAPVLQIDICIREGTQHFCLTGR